MSEIKHTPGEWNNGYGNGITGPTVPSCSGPTCLEACEIREWNEATKNKPESEWPEYPKEKHLLITVNDLGLSSSVVAILPFRNGEEIGNAHLIAAAPELLEAAKKFFDGAEIAHHQLTDGQYGKLADTPVGKELLAAISKAEGKHP